MQTEPFEAIAQFVGSHDRFLRLSNNSKLDFYALYKTAHGTAPDHTLVERLRLFCFDQTEYQKWLRWWLWSRQETPASAKQRYCSIAQAIHAYPSPEELQIMQNASTRGKGTSFMIAEHDEALKPDLDALIDACQAHDVAFVASFLKKGGDVNAKNEEGTSLLHFAVDANALSIVELLLTHQVAVDVSDDEGLTPLMSADLNGEEYLDMVKLLKESHAQR